MAWEDAKNLSYATSTRPVDGGHAHLMRIFEEFLQAEQETLPDDIVAHPRPVRQQVDPVTQVQKEGGEPSWRFRVHTTQHPFAALMTRGTAEVTRPITEVEVVKMIALITDKQREELMSDRDDAVSDWKIAAFYITAGTKKQQRQKRLDVDRDVKIAAWEGRKATAGSSGASQARPAQHIQELVTSPGFTLDIVWFDMGRQEEPNRGAFKQYRTNGYYPPRMQDQRDHAVRIVKMRLAREGVGEVSALPPELVAEVLQLDKAGMAHARIAELLKLGVEAVRRVVLAQSAAPKADALPPEKAPRKPRAKKPSESSGPPGPPEPPREITNKTIAP